MENSELRAGMLVELKNGEVGILIPWTRGRTLEVVGRVSGELHAIADAILRGSEEAEYRVKCNTQEYDIVKVYSEYFNNAFDALDPKGRKLLWEFSKPQELTVEQIEEILGYKIKIVGEKS